MTSSKLFICLAFISVAPIELARAEDSANKDVQPDLAMPTVVNIELPCNTPPCLAIEYITTNDEASTKAAESYITENLADTANLTIISIGYADTQAFTLAPLNQPGSLLLTEIGEISGVHAAPNDVQPQAEATTHAQHFIKKFRQRAAGLVANIPRPHIPKRFKEFSGEEKVYMIIRATVAATTNTIVAVMAGIDPMLAAGTLGTLGATYAGASQLYSAIISRWISLHGLFRLDPNKPASIPEVLAKRWGLSAAFLLSANMTAEWIGTGLPAIPPSEVYVVFRTAAKSVLASHHWSRFILDLSQKPNLTKKESLFISRFNFTMAMISSGILVTEILGFDVANILFGTLAVTGASAYYGVKLWTIRDQAKEIIKETLSSWFNKAYTICHQVGTLLKFKKQH